MSIAKKIANRGHEEAASLTTRHTSRHGLSKGRAEAKRILNRIAKRCESRIDFASQETD